MKSVLYTLFCRQSRWIACCSSLLLLILCYFPATVHADGGAPNLAYVAGAAQGVAVIDVLQRRVSKTVSVTSNPSMVLLSTDGSTLYVAQPVPGQVTLLDTTTGKARCTATIPGQPSFLTLAPEGDLLYVAGPGDRHVRVLDAHSCTIQSTFQIGEAVSGLTITLLGGAFPKHTGLYQLWVATHGGLTVFDTNGSVLDHFVVADPQYLTYATGFALYFTTRQGTVGAVDLVLHKVTSPLYQAGRLGTMDYNAATGEIYVPDLQHQQLVVLSPINPGQQVQTGKIVQRIALTSAPESVAITSDGQLGFVALQDGHVVMLDIPGRRIIATLLVGGHPRFIITGLYPPVTATPSAPAQTTTAVAPWRTPLLIFFIATFCLALLALIYLLLTWWKKRAS